MASSNMRALWEARAEQALANMDLKKTIFALIKGSTVMLSHQQSHTGQGLDLTEEPSVPGY